MQTFLLLPVFKKKNKKVFLFYFLKRGAFKYMISNSHNRNRNDVIDNEECCDEKKSTTKKYDKNSTTPSEIEMSQIKRSTTTDNDGFIRQSSSVTMAATTGATSPGILRRQANRTIPFTSLPSTTHHTGNDEDDDDEKRGKRNKDSFFIVLARVVRQPFASTALCSTPKRAQAILLFLVIFLLIVINVVFIPSNTAAKKRPQGGMIIPKRNLQNHNGDKKKAIAFHNSSSSYHANTTNKEGGMETDDDPLVFVSNVKKTQQRSSTRQNMGSSSIVEHFISLQQLKQPQHLLATQLFRLSRFVWAYHKRRLARGAYLEDSCGNLHSLLLSTYTLPRNTRKMITDLSVRLAPPSTPFSSGTPAIVNVLAVSPDPHVAAMLFSQGFETLSFATPVTTHVMALLSNAAKFCSQTTNILHHRPAGERRGRGNEWEGAEGSMPKPAEVTIEYDDDPSINAMSRDEVEKLDVTGDSATTSIETYLSMFQPKFVMIKKRRGMFLERLNFEGKYPESPPESVTDSFSAFNDNDLRQYAEGLTQKEWSNKANYQKLLSLYAKRKTALSNKAKAEERDKVRKSSRMQHQQPGSRAARSREVLLANSPYGEGLVIPKYDVGVICPLPRISPNAKVNLVQQWRFQQMISEIKHDEPNQAAIAELASMAEEFGRPNSLQGGGGRARVASPSFALIYEDFLVDEIFWLMKRSSKNLFICPEVSHEDPVAEASRERYHTEREEGKQKRRSPKSNHKKGGGGGKNARKGEEKDDDEEMEEEAERARMEAAEEEHVYMAESYGVALNATRRAVRRWMRYQAESRAFSHSNEEDEGDNIRNAKKISENEVLDGTALLWHLKSTAAVKRGMAQNRQLLHSFGKSGRSTQREEMVGVEEDGTNIKNDQVPGGKFQRDDDEDGLPHLRFDTNLFILESSVVVPSSSPSVERTLGYAPEPAAAGDTLNTNGTKANEISPFSLTLSLATDASFSTTKRKKRKKGSSPHSSSRPLFWNDLASTDTVLFTTVPNRFDKNDLVSLLMPNYTAPSDVREKLLSQGIELAATHVMPDSAFTQLLSSSPFYSSKVSLQRREASSLYSAERKIFGPFPSFNTIQGSLVLMTEMELRIGRVEEEQGGVSYDAKKNPQDISAFSRDDSRAAQVVVDSVEAFFPHSPIRHPPPTVDQWVWDIHHYPITLGAYRLVKDFKHNMLGLYDRIIEFYRKTRAEGYENALAYEQAGNKANNNDNNVINPSDQRNIDDAKFIEEFGREIFEKEKHRTEIYRSDEFIDNRDEKLQHARAVDWREQLADLHKTVRFVAQAHISDARARCTSVLRQIITECSEELCPTTPEAIYEHSYQMQSYGDTLRVVKYYYWIDFFIREASEFAGQQEGQSSSDTGDSTASRQGGVSPTSSYCQVSVQHIPLVQTLPAFDFTAASALLPLQMTDREKLPLPNLSPHMLASFQDYLRSPMDVPIRYVPRRQKQKLVQYTALQAAIRTLNERSTLTSYITTAPLFPYLLATLEDFQHQLRSQGRGSGTGGLSAMSIEIRSCLPSLVLTLLHAAATKAIDVVGGSHESHGDHQFNPDDDDDSHHDSSSSTIPIQLLSTAHCGNVEHLHSTLFPYLSKKYFVRPKTKVKSEAGGSSSQGGDEQEGFN